MTAVEPCTVTPALAVAVTVVAPALAVTTAVLVTPATQGTGFWALKPSLEGELWTSGISTPPKPPGPKAFLLTITS